jgi:integrase/recombinase XerD
MNDLTGAVEDYLSIRRSLGFKLHAHTRLLADFVDYLRRAELDTVTAEAALAWATRPAHASRTWWGQRLAVVRGFARHLKAFDPGCEVPPSDLLPGSRARQAQPHLFTTEDIDALMAHARRLTPRLRAATYETLIGLLAVTGMRAGEAIRLDDTDVDLHAGLVQVIGTKFGKCRQLPLHPSSVDALARYARLRDRLRPRRVTTSFLVSAAGSRLTHHMVDQTFARLVRATSLGPLPGSTRRPRPHDVRHSFAVRTLVGWYRSDADVQAHLPLLSTFLGHVSPASTYWYLSAAPQLLALASQRREARTGGPR